MWVKLFEAIRNSIKFIISIFYKYYPWFVLLFYSYFSCFLQFLEQCDEVVLMKNGEIAERGTHAHLLAKEGAYAEFVSFDRTAQQGVRPIK